MQRKILVGMLLLSIMFNLGITSVKAQPLKDISSVRKYQKQIENDWVNSRTIDDEKLVLEIDG